MSIRVLVMATDPMMVRAGFRMLLSGEKDIEKSCRASNGLEAVRQGCPFRPAVVLMDIPHARARRAGGDRRISAAENTTRILMLTTFDLDEYIYEALKAGGRLRPQGRSSRAADRGGAHGCRRKRCSPTITAIEHFTRITPVAAERSTSSLPASERSSSRRGRSLERGSRKSSARQPSRRTSHIFQKLNLRDRARAVVAAHQAGLLEADAPRAD